MNIDDLENLVNAKEKGFRRTAPNAAPQPQVKDKDKLYSQATSNLAGPRISQHPTNNSNQQNLGNKQQQQSGVGQQQHQQDRGQHEQQQKEAHTDKDQHQNRSKTIKYCHSFNNGKCDYQEKSGRKCAFEHIKSPLCYFDGNCTWNKCMYSHQQQNMNNSSFLGQRSFSPPQNNTIQYFMEQLMGTVLGGQTQGYNSQWGQDGRRRNFY